MNTKNILNLCLCQGRHEIPDATDGSIFPQEVNPLDVSHLEFEAFNVVWNKCYQHGYTKVEDSDWDEDGATPLAIANVHINLYVTGLTVALIAFLNAMKMEDVTITLYHFDRETGEYYTQEVK